MPRVVVYLRFPRNRNGFQDPVPVEWNAQKEKELWGMLKDTTTDLEWHKLAKHFGVSVVYILQQAAWLYEKELGVLRKRMSMLSTSLPASNRISPQYPDLARQLQSQNVSDADSFLANDFPGGPMRGDARPDAQSEARGDQNLAESGSVQSLDDDMEFTSRRLLSASHISSDGSDLSDSSMDGFASPGSPGSAMLSSTDSTVSQSALEAALMEQGIQSETSETA